MHFCTLISNVSLVPLILAILPQKVTWHGVKIPSYTFHVPAVAKKKTQNLKLLKCMV